MGVPKVGYPPLGYPPGQVRLGVGVPEVYPQVPPIRVPPSWLDLAGIPPHWDTHPARSDGGHPRWGYPMWDTPIRVPPRPGLTGGTQGTPLRTTPHGWLDLAGVPPPRRCGLTNKVKLLPSLSYYVRGRQLVNDHGLS